MRTQGTRTEALSDRAGHCTYRRARRPSHPQPAPSVLPAVDAPCPARISLSWHGAGYLCMTRPACGWGGCYFAPQRVRELVRVRCADSRLLLCSRSRPVMSTSHPTLTDRSRAASPYESASVAQYVRFPCDRIGHRLLEQHSLLVLLHVRAMVSRSSPSYTLHLGSRRLSVVPTVTGVACRLTLLHSPIQARVAVRLSGDTEHLNIDTGTVHPAISTPAMSARSNPNKDRASPWSRAHEAAASDIPFRCWRDPGADVRARRDVQSAPSPV